MRSRSSTTIWSTLRLTSPRSLSRYIEGRPVSRAFVFVYFLLAVFPLSAQRAQLARKGRQPDRAAAPAREPIRKLPRKQTPTVEVAAAPSATPPRLPDRPISEDRLRTLVRGSVTPLSPDDLASYSPHPTRRTPESAPVPISKPAVEVEAVPVANRWHIFPSAPWRRYEDRTLDAIHARSS